MTRFEQDGRTKDLEESIGLYRAALDLHPEGHANRTTVLNNLAGSLTARYERDAGTDDLEESIVLRRASLDSLPRAHPDYSNSLNDLACSLKVRFEKEQRADDLEEAIELHRAALRLRPEGNPGQSISLNNLASCLRIRFQQRRRAEDLEESIELHRAALALRPKGHAKRSEVLNDLAICLSTRFEQDGRADDLEESIQLHRDALGLRPEGHPIRSKSLKNLASSLKIRFQQSGKVEDLEESIKLHRAALALCPEGHKDRFMSMNNLAVVLNTRFMKSGLVEDLEESIALHRACLVLRHEGDVDYSRTLYNLADSLYIRFRKEGLPEDFEESIELLSRAATHKFSSSSMRMLAAQRWTKLARFHDHRTALDAYRTATLVLSHSLTIRPTLPMRHEFLSGSGEDQDLALDGASYAIEKGHFSQAIELLEQGRSLLWSQMRMLRTPLEHLSEMDKQLADRFRNVSSQLEALATSHQSHLTSPDVDDSGIFTYNDPLGENSAHTMLTRVRLLSEEQELIIDEIRQIPGFEDFLRAPSFEVLQQAALEGPVIVINHSGFRCDALIVLSRKDVPCVCVPLDRS
ncbi:hypothetical protein ACEPAF_5402 [Sanghuangporus sanghuang]